MCACVRVCVCARVFRVFVFMRARVYLRWRVVERKAGRLVGRHVVSCMWGVVGGGTIMIGVDLSAGFRRCDDDGGDGGTGRPPRQGSREESHLGEQPLLAVAIKHRYRRVSGRFQCSSVAAQR